MTGRTLKKCMALSGKSPEMIAAAFTIIGFGCMVMTILLFGSVSSIDEILFDTMQGLLCTALTALILYVLLVQLTKAVTASRDLARDNEQRLREIYNQLKDGIVVYSVNPDGKGITYVEANHAYFEMSGCRHVELIGTRPAGIEPRLLERLLTEGHALAEYELLLQDGTRLPVEMHARVFIRCGRKLIVSVYRDIRERLQSDEALRQLAYRDSLTNLANSHSFYRSIRQLTAANQPFSVIIIAMHRFQEIQEAFGRQKGSQLIQVVADRLQQVMTANDMLARVDNTTYKVIIPGEGREHATLRIHLIEDLLQLPIRFEEGEITPDFQLGTAAYPLDGQDEETLIMHAYQSLHPVQDQPFALPNMSPIAGGNSKRKLLLESDLKKAIQLGQLSLHFQPKIDAAANSVIGLEALVRWKHPRYGMVPPGEFVSIAEANGYMIPLGKWIVHHACQCAKEIQQRHGFFLPVAVNISLIQFMQGDIVETVREALDSTGLDASYLTLEITESMTMNPSTAMDILTAIKALGVHTSLDDFGTGFSSLAHLKQLPIDELKIDKTFIDDVLTNEHDRNIVRSIIAMAHNMEMKVVAEGVETPAQRNCLEHMGCDILQGYLISPPVDFDGIVAFIERFAIQAADDEPDGSFTQKSGLSRLEEIR